MGESVDQCRALLLWARQQPQDPHLAQRCSHWCCAAFWTWHIWKYPLWASVESSWKRNKSSYKPLLTCKNESSQHISVHLVLVTQLKWFVERIPQKVYLWNLRRRFEKVSFPMFIISMVGYPLHRYFPCPFLLRLDLQQPHEIRHCIRNYNIIQYCERAWSHQLYSLSSDRQLLLVMTTTREVLNDALGCVAPDLIASHCQLESK